MHFLRYCMRERVEITEIFLSSVGTGKEGLTNLFPMQPFSTPLKTSENRKFSGGRERVHWEQMG